MTDEERLQANWLDWVHEHLGADPIRAEAAATAAREAMTAGQGIEAAYAAARTRWASTPPSGPQATKPTPGSIEGLLEEWQAAGLLDAPVAARIKAFEASRPAASIDRRPIGPGINAGEVVAYVGAVVLLVGVSFLYGTEYDALGTWGRLVVIGLVVAAGLAAGQLVQLVGRTGAALRARAAGWSVAALGIAVWLAQALGDFHVLTRPYQYSYPGASEDRSGSVELAAAIAFLISLALLWRAGAGLLAFASAALAYTASGSFNAYARDASPWANESAWLASGIGLALASELLTRGYERRWAREVLRFMVVVPPALAALAFSNATDGQNLEFFAGLLAAAAFAVAVYRSSAGYAIGGGIALFSLVNEVGFRHFAQSVGFPIVLIISGITLFLVATGLFILLPRFRRTGGER